MYTTLWWLIGLVAVVGVIYGLHRLALHLEKQGLIYYLKEKPQSGAGSVLMPFQELIQPEIRHVIEVQDERRYLREESGEPPSPPAAPCDSSETNDLPRKI